MTESTLREANYRGQNLINRLAVLQIVVCGAGALGSNFVHEIVRQGGRDIYVIDDDRVEEHNISTQVYTYQNIGKLKTQALAASLIGLTKGGFMIGTSSQRLDDRNCFRLLGKAELVIDTFDNVPSRQLVTNFCYVNHVPCLHLGMSESGDYGHAFWTWTSSDDREDAFLGDPCEVAAARNLISIVVAMGCEAVMHFLDGGLQADMEFTLKDMRITVR